MTAPVACWSDVAAAFGLTGGPRVTAEGALPSAFACTDLAVAALAAVGTELAAYMAETGLAASAPEVTVDRRLASLWCAQSIRPEGWALAPTWDAIAGVYATSDGWIRLHTNLPHHRAAALSVLNCGADLAADRLAVAAEVARWQGDALETAIVAAGGVAAALRSRSAWQAHPNGAAVSGEPLVAWGARGADALFSADPGGAAHPPLTDGPSADRPHQGAGQASEARAFGPSPDRPLAGLRILDLTRVLAGPVSTRTLAGFGAEVLRIDPPGWDEANVVPDITLGKRCATLDLRRDTDRARFEVLLTGADVLVHGYRPGALDGLGYDAATRAALAPGLVEVTLNAYGWTGPWADRRGFDSLVQMSCGIAHAGIGWAESNGAGEGGTGEGGAGEGGAGEGGAGGNEPVPLPVQMLDHATGYLMAAAAIHLLRNRAAGQGARAARLSLARTAALLMAHPQHDAGPSHDALAEGDFAPTPERTPWGPARRLRPALTLDGVGMRWDRPAQALGSAPPSWS